MSVKVSDGRPLDTESRWSELREEAKTALEGVLKMLNAEYARYRYKLELFGVWVAPYSKEVELNLGYGTKYYEISEAVVSALEASDVMCETAEECEKIFERAYQDELAEINEECVIRINKKMEFPELGASVEVYPDECEGDYCFCGAGITIKIKLHSVNTVEDAVKRIVNTTRSVLNRIMPEVINV